MNSTRFRFIVFLTLVVVFLATNSTFAQSNDAIPYNTHNLSQEHSSKISHWHYKTGDDPTWSMQHLDMAGWKPVDGQYGKEYFPGIRWYRADIHLHDTQNEFDILALMVAATSSAYDLYWDGHHIGTSGTVAGSFDDEVSGPIIKLVRLKRELTNPGNHTLAIRLSNFHTKDKRPLGRIDIGYHYNFFYEYSQKSSSRVFVGGASLISGLFCIAMFFAGSRHRSYLLFAFYCFFSLFFDVFTILNLYNEINVEHYHWIIMLFRYGFVLSKLAFVIFVVFTYEIPRKALIIPLAILISLNSIWRPPYVPNYPLLSTELLPLLAGTLLLYSVFRKRTGSIAAFVGWVIWRLFKYPALFSSVFDNHLFFYIAGDVVFLSCVVFSISRMIHEQNAKLQEIQLRSSRLEVDLLKKNIQPHFILNTLQSIMNWIKKKPDNALLLIDALAEEFRMINRIAEKKLIPLHQEIDLCNTHLKLMGFRMGSTYELVTNGLCDDEKVPPMVFHTLIENALTHSFKSQESGSIHLQCEKKGRQTVYCLSNNGSRLRDVSQKSEDEIQEGMGLKYIKARLNESYLDNWSLDYTLDDEQWKVTIVIGHPSSS